MYCIGSEYSFSLRYSSHNAIFFLLTSDEQKEIIQTSFFHCEHEKLVYKITQ